MINTISIFICSSPEDKKYLTTLITNLDLEIDNNCSIKSNKDIKPGRYSKEGMREYLDAAHIILLLLSVDFIKDNKVDMDMALERSDRAYVVPIIVRPVFWKNGYFGNLTVLPRDEQPVSSVGSGYEEALKEVAKEIHSIVNEVRGRLPESTHNPDVVIERGPSSVVISSQEVPLDVPGWRRPFPSPLNWFEKALSVFVVILPVFSLFLFLPPPTCAFSFCHESRQTTQQPGGSKSTSSLDSSFSAGWRETVSPSFAFTDDPGRYSGNDLPPRRICAVLLPENPSSYCNIIIEVQNLHFGGADILIDSISLKLLPLQKVPQPLRIWGPGKPTTYDTYPYPVTYSGQSLDQLQNQLLDTTPGKNVILQPARKGLSGERDQISIQMMSTVTVNLQFQIQVTYQFADANTKQTKTLPDIFQVIFSDKSNWHQYILQNGIFVMKP